jgi:hypothetical protein
VDSVGYIDRGRGYGTAAFRAVSAWISGQTEIEHRCVLIEIGYDGQADVRGVGRQPERAHADSSTTRPLERV